MPLATTAELQEQFFEAGQAAARRHGFEIAPTAGSQLRDMAKTAAESILSRAQQLPTEKEKLRYVAANAHVGSIGMGTMVEQMIAARETLSNYAATNGVRLGEETLADAKRVLCPFLFFC